MRSNLVPSPLPDPYIYERGRVIVLDREYRSTRSVNPPELNIPYAPAYNVPLLNRMPDMLNKGIPIAAPRAYPEHLYVDVPTLARRGSRLVFLICLFALLMWAITGFSMIHPFIAVITMIGAIAFYIMGMITEKSYKR